jgi:gliding motility-associated-like protein
MKKMIISLLFLVSFSNVAFSFQKNLSGILNQTKASVVTIGADRVTVDDVTGFQADDTVLLIQMQGVRISTATLTYGTIQYIYGEPGMYEFLIVQSVTVATKEIVFRNNTFKTYDVRGSVQLIKVPYYNSVNVTGTLTCNQWNSSTRKGGVLALIVGRTLKLSANIDVTGKGFEGGRDTLGQGICRSTNPLLYDNAYYGYTFLNAGFKGKGVANYEEFGTLLVPNYVKGFGPNFTGGGGGNGRYSGGGGGSNRGKGGQGGYEDNFCSAPMPGGDGGFVADYPTLVNRIYMGGGGGASTSPAGLSPSGGSGGGIIIIVTDTIVGNGGKIIANGGSGLIALTGSGSGGGGGGGSIALSLNSYSTAPFELSVKGGNGGDNPGTFGEGGGGGGGLLWISYNTTGNVTVSLSGGLPGNNPFSSASPGNIGEKRLGFKATLNGFLFNSIRSSVTGDQVDSICTNVIPKPITGTSPVGGSGSYTYLWQRKNDSGGAPVSIPSSNTPNRTFTVPEIDTFFIRRVVKDNVTLLTDTSKWVKIFVQPAITGNLVGKDTTICYGQNPLGLNQLSTAVLAKGNGIYEYKWIQNYTNTNWNTSPNADGPNTNPGYDPPALTDTTYYERVVTSGRCVDYSPAVTITVLPLISGNIITRSDSVICEGSLFNPLGASAAGGGVGIYKYQWQDSIVSSVKYLQAAGTNTNPAYSPDTSTFSVIEKRFLRRVVFSGPDSVCQSRSLPILLTRYHKIKNNSISPLVQTIGHDSVPAKLNGLFPGNGNGLYSYLWLSKTNIMPWDTAASIYIGQNYSPAFLTDTTWYRRVVKSSVCKDTSNVIVVNVHKTIINNNISFVSGAVEDTICNGSTSAIFKGTPPIGGSKISDDYAFQWKSSANMTSGYAIITGATDSNYQPGALTQTTYFRRYVSSPKVTPTSVSESNFIKITVLPSISNFNIEKDQSVCKGNPLPPITSVSTGPSNGDNTYRYTWRQDSANTGWINIPGYIKSSSASYSRSAIKDQFRYKRYIYSGSNDCCMDSSNFVSISINDLPTGTITTITDTTICLGSQVPVKIHLTGAPRRNVVYTENATQITLNNILATDTTLFIKPSTTADFATFSYSLFSVQDKNGCIATSLSGSRKIDVYKIPKSIAGSDAAVCGQKYTLSATPSLGTGRWYYPAGVVDTTVNGPVVTVTVDSATAAWQTRYLFIWKENNWNCTDADSVIITFDKRPKIVDAGPDRDLYSFENVDTLRAAKLAVGTGIWSVISGSGNITNDTIANNLSPGENEFEWTVTNGLCVSADRMIISSYELMIPEGFSPNDDGINDEFYIKDLDMNYNEVSLKILNSAGAEVFFTSNIGGGTWTNWKGQNSKGFLPEGTYYYLLTIKSKRTNGTISKSGFIILKRY